MNLKFGKKPADTTAFAAGLKFGAMTDSELPEPPLLIGRAGLIADWGVLGNDICGDCAWAAACHRVMQWHAIAGQPVPQFTSTDAILDYADATGYVPGDESTDQGTSMIAAVAYQKATGIRDAKDQRHKVEGSMFLRPGDVDEVAKALYYFGALDIGVQLPSTAMDQFTNAEPWSVTADSSPGDGHCITAIARNSAGNFVCVTWGRIHAVTPQFFMTFMDEGFAYYSEDMLRSDQLSPRGIDKAGLLATLGKL
jgi:hypothetical protein